MGVEWAEFYNTAGRNTDNTYSNFDPTLFKDVQPNIYDYTTQISGTDTDYGSDQVRVYGNPTSFGSTFYVLAHRGYLYAQLTGLYTFYTYSVDDIVLLWLGSKAYSGWERGNADLVV